MSERLAQLLEQVWMNGLIERTWKASDGDVAAFKTALVRAGAEAGYVFEAGDVAVVDGRPVIDWPCVYVPETDQRRNPGSRA